MLNPVPHVASVHLVGHSGYQVEVRARRHELRADEGRARGGTDTGPSPMEMLLSALGACTAITLRMYAERKGWYLGEIRVDLKLLEHDGTQRIEREIRFAAELDPDALERLLEIAERTPVTRMVRSGTPIESRILQGARPSSSPSIPE